MKKSMMCLLALLCALVLAACGKEEPAQTQSQVQQYMEKRQVFCASNLCIEAQRYVLKMKSGTWAWRYSKAKYRKDIRPDFPSFRHHWMLWCVWQKCRLNKKFAELLKSVPDDVVIVEHVKKYDPVWATNEDENGILHGGNAMGKILTICRRYLIDGGTPNIDTDLLNASKIHILGRRIYF